MTEGVLRKILPGLRRRRRSVPAESTRGSLRHGFAEREEFESRGFYDRRATTQHAEAEFRKVAGIGEHPGVAGDAAHHESIFIVDFALNDPTAEVAIVNAGRDVSAPVLARAKAGGSHVQGPKDVFVAESVKRFSSESSEDFAKQDESDVAVLGADKGRSRERSLHGKADEFLAGCGAFIQFLVSGKAGRVPEEHAQGDALLV